MWPCFASREGLVDGPSTSQRRCLSAYGTSVLFLFFPFSTLSRSGCVFGPASTCITSSCSLSYLSASVCVHVLKCASFPPPLHARSMMINDSKQESRWLYQKILLYLVASVFVASFPNFSVEDLTNGLFYIYFFLPFSSSSSSSSHPATLTNNGVECFHQLSPFGQFRYSLYAVIYTRRLCDSHLFSR